MASSKSAAPLNATANPAVIGAVTLVDIDFPMLSILSPTSVNFFDTSVSLPPIASNSLANCAADVFASVNFDSNFATSSEFSP